MDADDVQRLGAGDLDGGPGEAAVADVGILPLAESGDGKAADDAVGQARAALLAGEGVGRSENPPHQVLGVAALVVEFLDREDVGLEALQDADAGVFVGLAVVVGQVRRRDRHGDGIAVRRKARPRARQQAQPQIDPATHGEKVPENPFGVHAGTAEARRPGCGESRLGF